jgi:succinate dehydrogenase / fumarate reductase cytochrome b subunit
MSWVKATLTSSIGKKLVMSITGLFLIGFLVAHLIGNISLLSSTGDKFNEYAHFMKHNTLIVLSEVVLFLGFIFHIAQGLILESGNRGARKQKYTVANKNEKVDWKSKYMGPFGVVILIFLLVHLWDFFRFKYAFPEGLGNVEVNGEMIPDLYGRVIAVYTGSILHVILYPLAMLVIGFHLAHGFQSAFQSLGWRHKKYTPLIKTVGLAYAVLVPLAFAAIPVLIYLGITIG